MRPTPIPDHEIWDGAVRRVIAPPAGDLDAGIDPVEALVDISPSQGGQRLSVRCVLEDGDLAMLAGGGTVWITFWGAMVPWCSTVMHHDPAPGEDPAETPKDVNDALVREVNQLHRWKREALEVIAGLQELGQALGMRPGERITGARAAEVARELRARAERAS